MILLDLVLEKLFLPPRVCLHLVVTHPEFQIREELFVQNMVPGAQGARKTNHPGSEPKKEADRQTFL